MINSLKKGNLQSATFIRDGQEVKQYLEANPQFKTVNVYDADKNRLDMRQGKEQQQGEKQEQSAKQGRGQSAKASEEDGTGEEKQKKQRRRTQKL